VKIPGTSVPKMSYRYQGFHYHAA